MFFAAGLKKMKTLWLINRMYLYSKNICLFDFAVTEIITKSRLALPVSWRSCKIELSWRQNSNKIDVNQFWYVNKALMWHSNVINVLYWKPWPSPRLTQSCLSRFKSPPCWCEVGASQPARLGPRCYCSCAAGILNVIFKWTVSRPELGPAPC